MDGWKLLLIFAVLSGCGPACGGSGGGGPLGSFAARPPRNQEGKGDGSSGVGGGTPIANQARSKYESELNQLRSQIERERSLREAAEREVELHGLRESLTHEQERRQSAQARAANVLQEHWEGGAPPEQQQQQAGVGAATDTSEDLLAASGGSIIGAMRPAMQSLNDTIAFVASANQTLGGHHAEVDSRPGQEEQHRQHDIASVTAIGNQTLESSWGLEPRPRQRQQQWKLLKLLNASDVVSASVTKTDGNRQGLAEVESRQQLPQHQQQQQQQQRRVPSDYVTPALESATLAALAQNAEGQDTKRSRRSMTRHSQATFLDDALHDAAALIRERKHDPQNQRRPDSSERRGSSEQPTAHTGALGDVEQRLSESMNSVMERFANPFQMDDVMLQDLRAEFGPEGTHRELFVQVAAALEQCWRVRIGAYDEATQSLLEAKDYLRSMDQSGFARLFEGFPEKDKEASRKVEQFLAQKMMELEWLAKGGDTMRNEAKDKALEKCKEEVRATKLHAAGQ